MVASALDLLGTKLKVIMQRAESKDYLDIAQLMGAGVTLIQGLGAAGYFRFLLLKGSAIN
jgi:hypothetical protein